MFIKGKQRRETLNVPAEKRAVITMRILCDHASNQVVITITFANHFF